MTDSNTLDHWVLAHKAALGKTGVAATAGRGPLIGDQPPTTWVSFETARSRGRLVLWGAGRCQLDASANDGTRLCAAERQIASPVDLDAALSFLIGQLDGVPQR